MEVSRFRPPRGITLVEVVVAMGLVFLSLLALSGLTAISLKGAATGKHLTTATFLAQEKLENLMQKGYDPFLNTPVTITEPYTSLPEFPLYQRVTVINPHQPFLGLQTITVTVSWAKDAHSVTLNTMLGE